MSSKSTTESMISLLPSELSMMEYEFLLLSLKMSEYFLVDVGTLESIRLPNESDILLPISLVKSDTCL